MAVLCAGAAILPVVAARDPLADIASQVPQAVATLNAYHGKLPASLPSKLHIIYWTPSDREPQPQYRERLSLVMETTADFYEKEMKRLSFPLRRLPLDRDADGLLKIHVVKGQQPYSHYEVKSGSEIRRECLPLLRQSGVIKNVSGDNETLVIFCNMSVWDAEKRTMSQNSPYYAGGTARGGTAWQVDSPLLDPALIREKGQVLKDKQYGNISVGRYNSIFVGGVIHELGHALGLPHNKERPDEEALFGTALMGSGNRTYGEELRGEGKGSFLTLAHALRLASHPLFTGSARGLEEQPKCAFSKLSFRAGEKSITVTGKVESTLPTYAMVGYSDPEGNGNYNQASASTIPQQNGTFEITFDALEAGKRGELVLLACHVNGSTTERRGFCYDVAKDGTPDISGVEAKLLLDDVVAKMQWANLSGKEIVASLPPATQSAGARLARAVANRMLLTGEKPSTVPADVRAELKTLPLADALSKEQSVGWGKPAVNRFAEEPFYPAAGGRIFECGIYAHAPARHMYALGGKWTTLKGSCGMAQGREGSVVFVIKGDGRELWRSKKVEEGVADFEVPLGNVHELELLVEDGGDGIRSDWGLWLNPEISR